MTTDFIFYVNIFSIYTGCTVYRCINTQFWIEIIIILNNYENFVNNLLFHPFTA